MDRRVSGWARPFVDDEPRNVTPGRPANPSQTWLRHMVDAWHAKMRDQAATRFYLAKINGARAVVLLVVMLVPPLPSWVHWLGFFGFAGFGAVALMHAEAGLSCRANARLEPDLLPEDE